MPPTPGHPTPHIERNDPRYQRLIRTYRAECAAAHLPCWLCHQPIDYSLRYKRGKPIPDGAFEADHYKTWAKHPALRMDRANLRPSHHGCNRNRSDKEPGEAQAPLALGEPSRDW